MVVGWYALCCSFHRDGPAIYGSFYLACSEKMFFFFTSEHLRRYHLWLCQNVCDALHHLYNICISFGSRLYRQVVGILMGTN